MFAEITATDLHGFGLDESTRKLLAAARPAVHCLYNKAPTLGASERSWLGGFPKVPSDFDWPFFGEAPLTFIAQICCEEVMQLVPEIGWPREGHLLFFLYWPGYPAFEVENPARNLCKVIFVEKPDNLAELKPPTPPESWCPFLTPGFHLTMSRRATLPSVGDAERFATVFGQGTWQDTTGARSRYLVQLLNSTAGPDGLARIGGYPPVLQPFYGDSASVLLFQFRDGGDGHWYFFIDSASFRERRFERAYFYHDSL